MKKVYKVIKRVLDILISLIGIILLLPIFLLIAIVIKLDSKGKVFYLQERIKKNGKKFDIIKFRTMVHDADRRLEEFSKEQLEEYKINYKLNNDPRITKVGKFLRKSGLDELPQLINILKGEMSFVGPRPWIQDYYEVFTEQQKHRSDVLPGLSGLAQVKGRNGIGIIEKIEYDLEYVRNASLKLDLKIFVLSIVELVKKSNAEISEMGIKKELNELKKLNRLNKEHIL